MVSPLMARVLAWEKAKTALDIAKKTEKDARDLLVATDFADVFTGTKSLEMDDGRVLKCVKSVKIEAVKDSAVVEKAIAKLQKTGNEGTFIADRLFAKCWKVSVAELKKLGAPYRKIADAAVLEKAESPSLEIAVPKSL